MENGYRKLIKFKEKVSCEIRESPSMMWKGTIVQAKAGCARAAALALGLVVFIWCCGGALGADLVIEIPGSALGEGGGSYRLDYRPPHGTPPPNYTVPARASTINFQGLPGTKYHFMLYYSNATFADLLTWNQTIITAPEPPTNLTVTLGRNKQATIAWSPPAHGDYTGFRFKVVPVSERAEGGARNVSVEGGANGTLVLRDLSPGATYQLHAFTLLHDKESAAYASRNFTTRPNTPGKFIVWFRNETTLLVLWQPPYPPGAYTHYKVSIVPPDARDSEQYVEKEGEPPGPAQAAFKGLVPGRAYNISVQTVSEPELSAPTTAQYRTVPLRPANVSVPSHALAETAFQVTWLPPHEHSEFEKYQVSVSSASVGGSGGGGGGGGRRAAPQLRGRAAPPTARFDGLEPGHHYTVTVKTMSGKVTSWPASADFTLKPLPVRDLGWKRLEGSESVALWWTPAAGSLQDEYKVWYHESGAAADDSSSLTTAATNVTLDALLPGRNYTLTVCAVSRGVVSNESSVVSRTRPLAPVLAAAGAGAGAAGAGRRLRLAWRCDVTSRQDAYRLRYRRLGAAAGASDNYLQIETTETNATLEDLFPGAVYEIQVAALSHGLASDWHTLLKPIRPLPAKWVVAERLSSRGVRVRWAGPAPAATALGGVQLSLAGAGAPALAPLPPSAAHADVTGLTPGERYTLSLDTLSEPAGDLVLPSGHPVHTEHIVRPSPVSNVAALADARNLSLEWPRPAGRVDWYELRWTRRPPTGGDHAHTHHTADTPTDDPAEGGVRNVSAEWAAGVGGRALLGGLRAGAAYALTITAHSHGLTSDPFTMDTRTRPLIQSEMTIVTESDVGDADDDSAPAVLKVIYTRTPESVTEFDSYRFRLEAAEAVGAGAGAEGARQVERGAAEAPQQVEFPALVPGRLYNVTMWTVAHNLTSHPVQRQARLYPRPIPWLNATGVGARWVRLAWAAPPGDRADFQLQYLAARDTLHTHHTTDTAYNVTGLKPYTAYTFTVVVRAGWGGGGLVALSRAHSASVRTREAPPAAPVNLRVVPAPAPALPSAPAPAPAPAPEPARLHIAWDMPPDAAHGRITRFVLTYEPEDGSGARVAVSLAGAARVAAAGALAPGAAYRLALTAETLAGAGPPATLRVVAPIGAPPPPAPGAGPREAGRAASAVSVRFGASLFSRAHGNLTGFALLVGEDAAPAPARPPSWRDVHRLPVWPMYQVSEPYYPFESSEEEVFTIGAERCEEGGVGYCNGPLKPNTKYYVKLRAFTAPDLFTDTDYTVVHTEVDNTAWIIGACVAAALAAGGAGAAVARARGGRGARAPPAQPPPALAARPERPVRVADFIDHYRLMSADSDFRFSEEFEELKHVGREQPCTAADLPCNRPKNRFTNILPYDHSRYKLQPVDDEEGSDYINANYVPGHNSPREFIVTQGPLHCTRDDFWRMCWESGSRAIVMLTRCVEKGREKCDRYWPYDTRPVYYGDIAVTALNESRYPDWTITELMVCRGAEQRVLKHFHFTTWPDFGVPDPPTTLARFVRAFRERVGAEARPVVVHCSAGVGRSGTFITLDRALQQLAAGADSLDVFAMVHAMRRERVWMVQTEQQYICIHQCIVAVLEGQDLSPHHHPHHHNHHHNPAFEDDEGIAESGM